MGYLPHTGGLSKTPHLIVVDAVLTEQGRYRLAKGDFNVTKFALGDDEIDYSLYDTSAATENQDDVIMLTPVIEAVPDAAVGLRHFLYTAPAPEGGFGIQPQILVSPETLTVIAGSTGAVYSETNNAVDPDFEYTLQFAGYGDKLFDIQGDIIGADRNQENGSNIYTLRAGSGGNSVNFQIVAKNDVLRNPGNPDIVLDPNKVNTFSAVLEIRGTTTGVLGTVNATWKSRVEPTGDAGGAR